MLLLKALSARNSLWLGVTGNTRTRAAFILFDARMNDPPTTSIMAKNMKLIIAGLKNATSRVPVIKKDIRAIPSAPML
jgi:hypothetical protein